MAVFGKTKSELDAAAGNVRRLEVRRELLLERKAALETRERQAAAALLRGEDADFADLGAAESACKIEKASIDTALIAAKREVVRLSILGISAEEQRCRELVKTNDERLIKAVVASLPHLRKFYSALLAAGISMSADVINGDPSDVRRFTAFLIGLYQIGADIFQHVGATDGFKFEPLGNADFSFIEQRTALHARIQALSDPSTLAMEALAAAGVQDVADIRALAGELQAASIGAGNPAEITAAA